jgi:hypothetical protein
MVRSTIFARALLVGLAVASACGQQRSEQPQASPVPARPAGAALTTTQVVDNWLLCEDCLDGELQALVRAGAPTVPLLAAALDAGPPQTNRDEARQRFLATHHSMTDYALTHPSSPVPTSEAEYVQRNLDHYVTMYQLKAARGLGAVGGPDAKRELTQALGLPLTADILTVVREVLGKMP